MGGFLPTEKFLKKTPTLNKAIYESMHHTLKRLKTLTRIGQVLSGHSNVLLWARV